MPRFIVHLVQDILHREEHIHEITGLVQDILCREERQRQNFEGRIFVLSTLSTQKSDLFFFTFQASGIVLTKEKRKRETWPK